MGLRGKRVLVTGGTGFIGSHLVEKLVHSGAKVVIPYQSLSYASYFYSKKLNERALLAVCDIKNFNRVRLLIAKYEIEIIFHLAAQPLVTVALDNPLETYETNIIGTANILESARLYRKISAILIASSDKAYGKIPRVNEKDQIGGDHPYETSKAAADLIAQNYYKTYKLPIVITRFGNVYGEGDLNFNRIVPGIMEAIINKEGIDIRSDGKYVRDYIYVGDVVEAMVKLVQNIKRVAGEAFNVSSNDNYSVLELLKKICQIIGVKLNYKILKTAFNEIPKQSVNYNKIIKTIGWKPQYSLDSTISTIHEWYKKNSNLL